MSDQDKTNQDQDSQGGAGEEEAPKAVKRGGLAVVILIVFSLVLYLTGDRYTPYTTQARVQGYVVGVAPQVSGNVIEVLVENNQKVEVGQVLFKIDPTQYEMSAPYWGFGPEKRAALLEGPWLFR